MIPSPFIVSGPHRSAGHLADLTADGLTDLPVAHWLVPDSPARRLEVLRAYTSMVIEHALGGAGHIDMFADGSGCAVWLHDLLPVVQQWPRMRHRIGVPAYRFAALDAVARGAGTARRDVYLALIAVAPDCRGNGWGRQLISTRLARVGARGLTATALLWDESLLRVVAPLGFRALEAVPLPGESGAQVLPVVWSGR